LSEVESRLVAAGRRGVELVCGTARPDELSGGRDGAHVIRAELIRELLLGRFGELDPRGVRVRGARVTGVLDLSYVRTTTGLHLIGCWCEQPFVVRGARLPRLHLSASHVRELVGDGLRVDGNVRLDEGFTATGNGAGGAVGLVDAHITGALRFDGARLANDSGPALDADRLRVDGGMFVRDGFTAVAAGERGAIRLLDARVTGPLELDTARLANDSGPALVADGLRVDGGMFLGDGFTATGHSARGTIVLRGAHVTGALKFDTAQLVNSRGLLLDLLDVQAGSVFLPAGVVCPSGADTPAACAVPTSTVDLDGLRYTALGAVSWQQWLHLVRRHTTAYRAGPYQQLAAVRRAAGHDGDARDILIAQQEDLRARGRIGGRFATVVHWLWGALAGYGYRAGRLALALLVVLALAGDMGWWAGHTATGPGRHAAQHTTSSATPGAACSTLEQIGLGIDRGLPLGSTGIRTYCDLDTTSPAGQWFTLAIWILQTLVWALATLAVAGYTGLVRKIT